MSDSADHVLRLVQRRTYKTIPLVAVEDDPGISWKAVGLHTYMITRPDGWDFFRGDLVNRHTDGRDGVKSGLKELREAGYLRTRPRPGGGHSWFVSERPMSDDEWAHFFSKAENPAGGNPADGEAAGGEPGRITGRTSDQQEREGSSPKKRVSRRKRRRAPAYTPAYEELWQACPKGSKWKGFEELRKAELDGILPDQETLVRKRAEYRAQAEANEHTPQAIERWIRDARWDEEYETPASAGGYDWDSDPALGAGHEAA